MPVQSETSRIQYTGNNSSVTPYTVPFLFLASGDLAVVVTDEDGVETTLTETTDYTVTGAGEDTGGEVVTVDAVPATSTVTIYREPEATQLAEFQATGRLPAATLTDGLDRLTMLVQSLLRKVSRCFRFTDSSADVDAVPGTNRASKVLGFDSSGDAQLYDRTTLLSLLSLGGSVTGASTAYWADDGERATKVPDFTGQLGLQLNTSALYRSTGTSAGNWSQFSFGALSGSISDLPGTLTLAKFADAIITYAKLQNVSSTQRVLGRNTAGAGVTEEVTLTQLLDWIGSAAQGDLLYRGAASWARLGAGTAGQVLRTGGAGANPSWGDVRVVNVWRASTSSTFSTTTTIPYDNTVPQNTEGAEVLTIAFTPSSTSNFLHFHFSGYGTASGAAALVAALFRDSVAGAVFAKACGYVPTSNYKAPLDFHFWIQVPSTSSQTWKIRVGPDAAVTAYINRDTSGSLYDTVDGLFLTVMEVLP